MDLDDQPQQPNDLMQDDVEKLKSQLQQLMKIVSTLEIERDAALWRLHVATINLENLKKQQ